MRHRPSFMFMGRFRCKGSLWGWLVAAKTAVEIFIASGWANRCPLVLVLDCKVLVNLFENWMQRPWALSKFFAEFESECKLIQFRFIERVKNEMAASLAIDGFSRRDCFKAWW
ncbi:hypothetical protein V6N13_121941 [Hibiscus sabdariffa]